MRRCLFALLLGLRVFCLAAPPAQVRPSTTLAPPGSRSSCSGCHDGQRAAHRRASRRRGLGVHRARRARRSRARRLPVAEPRRRRPEHHRPRALRRARRHPHRGAAAGAPSRRRRAVLHARLRLRLLEDARRGGGEVERARGARRHGARHPHVPAARRSIRASPARRPTGTASIRWPAISRRWRSRRPPIRRSFPSSSREGLRPWQAKKLYRRRGRGARCRHRRCRCRPASLDPAARPQLRGDCRRRTQPAQVAGDGRHRAARAGGVGAASCSRRRRCAGGRGRAVRVRRPRHRRSPGWPRWRAFPTARCARELQAIDDAAAQALRRLPARWSPTRIVPVLAAGLRADARRAQALRQARRPRPMRVPTPTSCSPSRNDDFADALVRAAGVVVDPLADAETVVPGGHVDVTVRTFAGESRAGHGCVEATARARAGRAAAPTRGRARQAPDQVARAAGRRQPTRIALRRRRARRRCARRSRTSWSSRATGDMYQWPADAPKTACRSRRRS